MRFRVVVERDADGGGAVTDRWEMDWCTPEVPNVLGALMEMARETKLIYEWEYQKIMRKR